MKSLIILCGLIAVAAGFAHAEQAPTSQPSTQRSESPQEVAQLYVNTIGSMHYLHAVQTYWDFDAMFDVIFGDDMKQMTDADRVKMRGYMPGLIMVRMRQNYQSEYVANEMAHAAVSATHDLPDHRTIVEYSGRMPAFYLAQRNDRWRIVDTATSARGILGETLQSGYLGEKASGNNLTPLGYLKLVNSRP